MSNVTFTADEELIERARRRAAQEKKTLNIAFREWLARYAGCETGSKEYGEIMRQLSRVKATRRFSRDEMNER